MIDKIITKTNRKINIFLLKMKNTSKTKSPKYKNYNL